mgnify:CR=1 FL=1
MENLTKEQKQQYSDIEFEAQLSSFVYNESFFIFDLKRNMKDLGNKFDEFCKTIIEKQNLNTEEEQNVRKYMYYKLISSDRKKPINKDIEEIIRDNISFSELKKFKEDLEYIDDQQVRFLIADRDSLTEDLKLTKVSDLSLDRIGGRFLRQELAKQLNVKIPLNDFYEKLSGFYKNKSLNIFSEDFMSKLNNKENYLDLPKIIKEKEYIDYPIVQKGPVFEYVVKDKSEEEIQRDNDAPKNTKYRMCALKEESEEKTKIFISFRGTELGVTKGWMEEYVNMRKHSEKFEHLVEEIIKEEIKKNPPGKKMEINFSGHSLGAATAERMSVYIQEKFKQEIKDGKIFVGGNIFANPGGLRYDQAIRDKVVEKIITVEKTLYKGYSHFLRKGFEKAHNLNKKILSDLEKKDFDSIESNQERVEILNVKIKEYIDIKNNKGFTEKEKLEFDALRMQRVLCKGNIQLGKLNADQVERRNIIVDRMIKVFKKLAEVTNKIMDFMSTPVKGGAIVETISDNEKSLSIVGGFFTLGMVSLNVFTKMVLFPYREDIRHNTINIVEHNHKQDLVPFVGRALANWKNALTYNFSRKDLIKPSVKEEGEKSFKKIAVGFIGDFMRKYGVHTDYHNMNDYLTHIRSEEFKKDFETSESHKKIRERKAGFYRETHYVEIPGNTQKNILSIREKAKLVEQSELKPRLT